MFWLGWLHRAYQLWSTGPGDTGFGGFDRVSGLLLSCVQYGLGSGDREVKSVHLRALTASKKGMQLVDEGPRVPVPDTGSTAHNEAFNETLGSPARLPPVRCLLGIAGTAGPMHAGCSISAPRGCTSRLQVYRIRVKRLSTDTDSWEQGTSDHVPGCPENPRGVTM